MHDDFALVNAWARSMRARNLSKLTVYGYSQTLTQLIVWCHEHNRTLRDITHRDVRDWLDTLTISPTAYYTYTSRVSTLYTWLIREDMVEHDPTKRIDRPKLARRLPRPAASEAVREAMAGAEPRTAAMIALGAFAGMRRFEIANLRVEDLFLRREPPTVVVHGKGQKDRVLVLNGAAVSALREHGLPRSGFVFEGRRPGRPLSVKHTGDLIADALSGVSDERVTTHQLRHWFASEIYAATHDLRLTQEVMGHASPATTAIYAAFSNQDAERAVTGLSLALPEVEDLSA